MKEADLNLLQRKIESAKESRQEAIDIENEAHAFIWESLDSICGKRLVYEREMILYSPSDKEKFSLKDLHVRGILGLDQKEPTNVLVTIRKRYDEAFFSVKMETREKKVVNRKSIIFQITRHGAEEKPIWGTRMSIGGIERGEEISTELNQPNKSFERLENGLYLLNFISN